ncbi:L-asparaginase isoform X1 [Polyergus mexicanus]|uniref:L-asparaginase isoform X1 n=1 Tax=Polyergus mexicanus TaxID=615972 RepID=UPI0038B4A4D5
MSQLICELHDAVHDTNNGVNMESVKRGITDLTNKPEGHVLVLYTGGTIGMVRNEQGVLVPRANAFIKNLRKYPQLHDREYAEKKYGAMGPLVLPVTATDNRRVVYNVLEYSNLCDSSNMTMDEWIRIANDIKVIVFTSLPSAGILRALRWIRSPSGYRYPKLHRIRSVLYARGSRQDCHPDRFADADFRHKKRRPGQFPGVPCDRGELQHTRGMRVLRYELIARQPDKQGICKLLRGISLAEFSIPGYGEHQNRSITSDLVKVFLQPPIEGVVLQSYGTGNVPTNRDDIIEEFRAATKRGVIIVNITQCTTGCVSDAYEAATLLQKSGVISGFDMTPEAALTKLAYVLSKREWDTETKRQMMETNLRGELTAGRPPTMQDCDLVEAVARSLRLSSAVELQELGSILFPAMLDAAVIRRDIVKLESLQRYGANISQANADGRTVLHIACCEGDINVVRRLLKMGANVHIKDRFNRTSLTDAIEYDRHEIIKVLLQCGAHLHDNALLIGERMCTAAAIGNTKRLQSYLLAGVDLSQKDVSGRTPLHFAALHNHTETIEFLLDHGADPRCIDMLGQTAAELAEAAQATDVIRALTPFRMIETNIDARS